LDWKIQPQIGNTIWESKL